MKTRPPYLIVTVVCLALVLVALQGTARASFVNGAEGLDLVFLIDQSGTMGGQAFSNISLAVEENDPLDLRFAAPLFAMDWLARAYLEYGSQSPGLIRVGVVYFGATADVAPGLDRFIQIAPQKHTSWESQYANLATLLTPERLASDSSFFREKTLWCCTNFVSAFQKAAELFAAAGSGANRSQVVVILSDGLPDPEDKRDYSQAEMNRLMPQVQAKAKEVLPNAAIYLVAFDNLGQPSWSKVSNHWQDITGGRAKLVADNLTLGADLQEVLFEIVQPILDVPEENEIECGGLRVPPYLQSLNLTIHKPNPSSRVRLQDPLGSVVTGQEKGATQVINGQEIVIHGQDAPIESVSIRNPQPGLWQVGCPSGNESMPRIFVQQVSSEMVLDVGRNGGAQFVPMTFVLSFQDFHGSPASRFDDASFPLEIKAKLKSERETIPLEFVPTSQDQEVYVAHFTPITPGIHHLSLSAAVRGSHSIAQLEQDYEVRPSFLAIRNDKETWLQGASINVQAGFVDDMGRVFTYTGDDVEVWLHLSQGGQQESIPMSLSDGVFSTEYVPLHQGPVQLWADGKHIPPTGDALSIASAGTGSAKIQGPLLALVSQSKQFVEKRQGWQTFALVDEQSRPYSQLLAPGLTLDIQAYASGALSDTPTVQLLDNGQFQVQFTPLVQDASQFTLEAVLRDQKGREYPFLQQSPPPLTVIPYSRWLQQRVLIFGALGLVTFTGLAIGGAIFYHKNLVHQMPAKLLLENEYHSREISLDRPERTFVWREVGSGKEGEPDWDSCVVDHVRITHLNKPPERRIVRVDVVYKDGKLPRAFELMVGDDENPMPLYRDGMFIHLMRE